MSPLSDLLDANVQQLLHVSTAMYHPIRVFGSEPIYSLSEVSHRCNVQTWLDSVVIPYSLDAVCNTAPLTFPLPSAIDMNTALPYPNKQGV